jgi:DNA-binding LytR/AlgR family response regulator
MAMCGEYFSKDMEYTLCGVYNNPFDVVNHLRKSKIDLLFLDIDMPEMNGFDLARRVSSINPEIMIVFISAYDQFVFQSFKYSPLAYLRKSRISEELPNILKRVDENAARKSSLVQLDAVDGYSSLPAKDILYIRSVGNYYIITTSSGEKIRCRGTLYDAEKLLTGYDFFRVHSAYIVNMDNIRSIREKELTVVASGEVIPIAQRRRSPFKKAYESYVMSRLEI